MVTRYIMVARYAYGKLWASSIQLGGMPNLWKLARNLNVQNAKKNRGA
jgi:hypothetical protein